MSEDIRIGFVGCGGIGNHHMRSWQSVPGAKVVAVCDIIPERADTFAQTHGAKAYHDFAEMLKAGDFDAVDICTPSGLHATQGIMAAEAGKHVLSEKPIDVDLEKVDRLIEITDRKGLKLACIFQYRTGAQVQKVHQLIEEGAFGRIISGSCYVKWWRDQNYYSADDWRGTWALDGGVLSNQAIHSIDQMCWMTGPVAEVEYAHMETIERRIEAETFAIAVVRFENGARGVVEGTTNCVGGMGSKCQVFGTKGTAEFEGAKVTKFKVEGRDIDIAAETERKPDGSTDPMAISLDGHGIQMFDFVTAIREDKPVLCDGRSARVAVDCLTKIYRKGGYTGKLGT